MDLRGGVRWLNQQVTKGVTFRNSAARGGCLLTFFFEMCAFSLVEAQCTGLISTWVDYIDLNFILIFA